MPSILNSWWNLPDIIKHIVASSAWQGREGTKINKTNLIESVQLIATETEGEIRSKLAFDYLVTNTDKSMCTPLQPSFGMSRNAPRALRDISKDGCEGGDYVQLCSYTVEL